MQLVLTRKITYHLFRTYLPSGLFVIIGWFSLFIPLDHVPGRVTMGMTTLLTLAAMFSAIATTTPRVSYRYSLEYLILPNINALKSYDISIII